MSLKSVLTVSLLCGVMILQGCDSEEAPPVAPLQPVRVQSLTQDKLSEDTRYTANIEADKQVNIAFKITGYVTTLMQMGTAGAERAIQAGDIVKKGDLLATVDSKDISDSLKQANSQVASAQANLNKANEDYKRANSLFKSNSMTEPDYDSAKQEYENAVAQMQNATAQQKIARNNVKDFDLVAPLGGVVLQRNVDVGTLVSPQTVGFVIADTAIMKAVFGVPDTVVQSLKVGTAQNFTTQTYPDKVFDGTISEISPAADASSRVFDVKINVPNTDNLLKVGMIASLTLPKGNSEHTAALIPLSAIVRAKDNPEGYAVFVLSIKDKADYATLKTVELGPVHGNKIAVLGGLEAADRVVISGATFLSDGEQVAIIP
ncbi:efflux RND transporter periplasmic adaptor subunit [Sneathiella sp.]|uniref:efflux RND transporter periplasmic adaptor subunit n=1 Tax=Sneathiella sp. TaxID=1964365 RepID=UPI003563D093